MTMLLHLALVLLPGELPLLQDEDEAELSVDIGVHELKAHVQRLASREFLGRRGPGAARASQHIADAFQRLQLQPAFSGSYFQPIPWLLADLERRPASFIGRNVAAYLPGTDPQLKDEWVVLSAHFDHLGQKGREWFPGADDNASGVAMLLEVAERFALQSSKPRRSIYFVAFDQEESGLLGSTYFATKPPRDFAKLKAFLTADMIGRSMVNVMDEYVFVLGSETSPRLRRLLEEVKPADGLKIGRIGADLIGSRSDYGPFRDRRIPFLFFSTGQHSDYHKPSDRPEKLDYAKLQKISLLMSDLTWRLANDRENPRWETSGNPDLEEMRTALILIGRVLERPKAIPLNDAQTQVVRGIRDRLQSIVDRGEVTRDERTWLVWTSRLLLATIF